MTELEKIETIRQIFKVTKISSVELLRESDMETTANYIEDLLDNLLKIIEEVMK